MFDICQINLILRGEISGSGIHVKSRCNVFCEAAQDICRLLGALALGSLHCWWVEELFPQFSFVSVVFPC